MLPENIILGKYFMHIGSLQLFPQMEKKEGSTASPPVDCRALRKETQIQSRVSFPVRAAEWGVAMAPALILGSRQGTCNAAATSYNCCQIGTIKSIE